MNRLQGIVFTGLITLQVATVVCNGRETGSTSTPQKSPREINVDFVESVTNKDVATARNIIRNYGETITQQNLQNTFLMALNQGLAHLALNIYEHIDRYQEGWDEILERARAQGIPQILNKLLTELNDYEQKLNKSLKEAQEQGNTENIRTFEERLKSVSARREALLSLRDIMQPHSELQQARMTYHSRPLDVDAIRRDMERRIQSRAPRRPVLRELREIRRQEQEKRNKEQANLIRPQLPLNIPSWGTFGTKP